MRQAGWIAFLLFTVGLVTYEASIDPSTAAATSDSSTVNQTDEGGGQIPWDNPPK
jgi:hypothetical protein